jgi:hypothetical protein
MGGYQLIPVHTTAEISQMSRSEHKRYESWLRRAVRRQRHTLSRTRTRDPFASDYGKYTIYDDDEIPVARGLNLEEVAVWVNSPKR